MMRRRAFALNVAATLLTLAATVVSAMYVTSHLKNPGAPLQPPVLTGSGSAGLAVPGGGTLTLAPSTRPADVQPITSTYAS